MKMAKNNFSAQFSQDHSLWRETIMCNGAAEGVDLPPKVEEGPTTGEIPIFSHSQR
jgi:hypothetical protein